MTHYTEPDTTKLDKIRALLDKAESTDSPEEAESLTAKAVEWMERYRIDEAMIADAAPLQDRGKIIERTFSAGSGPYSNARVALAQAVASNHSVMLLQSTGYRGKTVYLNGYETDVALTEMLYTSLLVQATRAMNHPDTKSSKPDYVHGTAFNRAFLLGFAEQIDTRLREANTGAAQEHDTANTGRSVALVLADRSKDVEEAVFARYGKLRSARSVAPAASSAGLQAGATAADRADLSTNRRVAAANRKALLA